MAGLETDLGEMRRVGRVAIFSGISGVIFPVVLGFLVALPFGFSFEKALFIGFIMAATSAGISVQTLRELDMLKKREGVALLGAAVLDDVLVVLLLALFLALADGGGGAGPGLGEILLIIIEMVVFFAVTIFLGSKVLPWLLVKVKALPVNETLTATVLGLILLVSWAAQYLGGVATIVGAFLVGALVGRTSFKHELEGKFNVLVSSLFVPVFFISIGLILDIKALEPTSWILAGVVTITAIISKIIGGGLGGRLGGFNNLSSLRLGLGMVSRGDVGLIVALIGINEGIIDNQVYAAAVVMVLVTTIFTPIALKIAFKSDNSEQPEKPLAST